MSNSKDSAIRHLESVVSRETDALNFYLGLSAQKPMRDNDDKQQEDHLTEAMKRNVRR